MTESTPTTATVAAAPDTTTTPATETANTAGFFVNAGTHSGWFTTPDGYVYDIRKLEPRDVTDPRSGEVATIWGGYATARDRDLAAADAQLQSRFEKSGERPAEIFEPESRDIPLYITLRNRPGKGFTDIGSFWNARGRYTILARDLAGKRGLRFGGNVLAWKSRETLDAERASSGDKDGGEPDAEAARGSARSRPARRRVKSSEPKQS